MIGFDTGFFIELLRGHKTCRKLWERLKNESAIVSCLTFYELKKLAFKGVLNREEVDHLINVTVLVCEISWLNTIDVLSHAAQISHGTGIHSTDSLILAGIAKEDVHTIYTTDSDMERYQKKGLKIVNLFDTDNQ